jgi:hemoglobin
MRRGKTWKLMILLCLAVSVWAGAAQTQEKKSPGKPLDRAALDESIYQNLRSVIDHGANLYNQGDWNGCYRLWEGALMTLKPLLDHRPKLQEAIDSGIASARQDPALWHRAWVLRPVLDKIRADINADYPHRGKREAGSPPVASSQGKGKRLWDRLGGEAGVTKIVDDFAGLAAPDPKVDFSRGGKYKPTDAELAKMKRELVEQISEASGGPLKYRGPDMKTVHKGMGITDAQFNAAAADLKKALEKNNVAPEDVEKVLNAVGSYRKEIVEPQKQEEKKPADKKEGNQPGGGSRIEGKVTFQGKPLGGGIITFTGNNRLSYSAPIGPDGAYLLDRVQPGEFKVAIDTKAVPNIPQVPAKYSDSDKSGLTTNVREGKMTFDLDLR